MLCKRAEYDGVLAFRSHPGCLRIRTVAERIAEFSPDVRADFDCSCNASADFDAGRVRLLSP